MRQSPGLGAFLGRQDVLASLSEILEPAGPELAIVGGVPGIGKSALLEAFARRAKRCGRKVHVVDCRLVEPTEEAFAAILRASPAVEDPKGAAVLCLDHFDHFGLLGATLRAWFRTERPDGLRLILCGRRDPGAAWDDLGTLPLRVRVDRLAESDARTLVEGAGLAQPAADAVLEIARGHPLACRLAAAVARGLRPADFRELGMPEVVDRLAGYFLEDVPDDALREAVEAASTVRRLTRPLLATLLGEPERADLYDALAELPVVERRSDGLSLHPAVHGAVAMSLESADPARFTAYRRRAWGMLEAAIGEAGAGELWRYTADVIYLIEDPVVREAFFPSRELRLTVDPAQVADHASLLAIAGSQGGAGERERVEGLLARHPDAFWAVRDATGSVQGYSCLLTADRVNAQDRREDPMLAAWCADLPDELRAPGRTLFLRRWLARELGDLPSPVQAACWLDVKRAYLALRPSLRRVYLAVSDLAPYATAAGRLGFRPVCADAGLPLASAMLDFGPGSVDAWLAGLLRAELGVAETVTVDRARHGVVVAGRLVPLTARELAVASILAEAQGAVVGRDELLERAWDGGDAVGSNVVDVLIRGLRRKLGEHAGCVETVRGAGYRWAP